MPHQIEIGADGLVMDVKDHVATVLRDMSAGETVRYYKAGSLETVLLKEAIPFGHKVAIVDIALDEVIYKYGDIIGKATQAIAQGKHVHVHNIAGIRGRGDLTKHTEGS